MNTRDTLRLDTAKTVAANTEALEAGRPRHVA